MLTNRHVIEQEKKTTHTDMQAQESVYKLNIYLPILTPKNKSCSCKYYSLTYQSTVHRLRVGLQTQIPKNHMYILVDQYVFA